MLRQMLLNSTAAAARDLDAISQTHAPAPLDVSHAPVSVSALLKPAGRGGAGGDALREGELSKPDLTTYVVMCIVLFLLVLLIVIFINCQLRNSFFASTPYDRSLREARTSYKWIPAARSCNVHMPCDGKRALRFNPRNVRINLTVWRNYSRRWSYQSVSLLRPWTVWRWRRRL